MKLLARSLSMFTTLLDLAMGQCLIAPINVEDLSPCALVLAR
uniref:Uncharacterized protein n=1 Tax=Lotus japonicus TaxID=34305 RepID=I3SIC7_LOTJA|nr:unknown [Lotus japonicus]